MLVSADKLSQAVSRFGTDYTELVFNRYQRPPSSIVKAVEGGAPTFIDVNNYFSREGTLMWLRFHIAETFAFLGIYDTASKYQVQQTAELILDHEMFKHLNLDEFLQFLSQFKRGDYGKIYQSARPNPQELLACLSPFWNDLMQHRIRAQQREEEKKREQQRKEEKANAISYEEYLRRKEKLNEVVNKLSTNEHEKETI